MEATLVKSNNPDNTTKPENGSFWNLDHFKEKMLALKFARSIENIFNVYIDDPVNQVYTNYSLTVYTEQSISILLCTDPYSDSIFDGIASECLKPSRWWIFPGAFFNKAKYKFVLARMPGKSLENPEALFLPSKVLERISHDYMPVITSQGLCEFKQSTPCLNLQFVDIKKLNDLGTLPPIKMNDLVRSLSDKVEALKQIYC